jgi:DNA-binding NarL/FixJ family response regulator
MNLRSSKTITAGIFSENSFFASGLEVIVNDIDNCKVVLVSTLPQNFLEQLTPENCPEIGLLDLDIHLAANAAFLRDVKASFPQLRIIIMSQMDHPYNIRKAMHLGASGHLSKNADCIQIHRAVVSVFFTGSYFGPDGMETSADQAHTGDALFSEQEIFILRLFCSELSLKDIAASAGLGIPVIEGYRQLLFDKLHVTSRESLIVTAYKIGLVSKTTTGLSDSGPASYLPNRG